MKIGCMGWIVLAAVCFAVAHFFPAINAKSMLIGGLIVGAVIGLIGFARGKMSGIELVWLIIFVVYFAPWVVALRRSHKNATPIFDINLCVGWSDLRFACLSLRFLSFGFACLCDIAGYIIVERFTPRRLRDKMLHCM